MPQGFKKTASTAPGSKKAKQGGVVKRKGAPQERKGLHKSAKGEAHKKAFKAINAANEAKFLALAEQEKKGVLKVVRKETQAPVVAGARPLKQLQTALRKLNRE